MLSNEKQKQLILQKPNHYCFRSSTAIYNKKKAYLSLKKCEVLFIRIKGDCPARRRGVYLFIGLLRAPVRLSNRPKSSQPTPNYVDYETMVMDLNVSVWFVFIEMMKFHEGWLHILTIFNHLIPTICQGMYLTRQHNSFCPGCICNSSIII